MSVQLRLVLIIIVLFALAACSDEPIRIGVVVSSEGQVGAQLAVDKVNAAGGIHGRRLALRVMSGGASTLASPAIVAAESLAADRDVVAVVGHSNSSASLAASPTYNNRHLVHLAPTSSVPLLTDAGPYTFRLVSSDKHQARFLADQVAAMGAYQRVAILYVNDDYGVALFREASAQLAERGMTVVYRAPYSEDAAMANTSELAGATASARPDVLLWIGRPVQLRAVLQQLGPRLPGLRVLGSDGVGSAAARQNANGILTGVQVVSFTDPTRETPTLQRLRGSYRDSTGGEMGPEMLLAYDAVGVIAEALRHAGTDRESVRLYLAALGTSKAAYDGVSGEIAFDANGDGQPRYYLLQIEAP